MRWGPPLFGGRPRPLRGGLLAVLHEANQLFNAGRYQEAGPLFARLAQEAEAHHMPRRAVQLHLRAAESFGLAGNGQTTLVHARATLDTMLAHGRTGQASQALERLLAALRRNNLAAEADTLQREYQGRLSVAAPMEPAGQPPGRLPAQCPQCAAPVRSDEVEWIDSHNAACAYCGSILQAE